MRNDGFTLIEMLLVLSVIGMFVVLFPFVRTSSSILLHYQMLEIKQKLLSAQQDAMMNKNTIFVDFQGNQFTIDDSPITLMQNTTCQATPFHFTAQGTISKGQTIKCWNGKAQKDLVIQLGSGRMYVR